MQTPALLDEMARRADVADVSSWLRSSTPEELAEAKAWYASGRARMHRWYGWRSGEIAQRLQPEEWGVLPWIEAIFAVALAGPVSAGTWVPWRDLSTHRVPDGRTLVTELARGRGPAWCADFVPAAAAVRMGARDLQLQSFLLYDTLRELIAAFDLAVPPGAAFAVGWTHSLGWKTPEERLDRLVEHPLVPDVIHELLASGYIVKMRAGAEVALHLIAKGRIDPERLLKQSVELLSTVPSVGTQRYIAALLSGLPLGVAEIPRELGLLQGLIATCHGSVGAVLLPNAIDALATEDDLVELTTTIVGRTERRQKDVLIKALESEELRRRLGVGALRAALEVIRASAGDDPQLAAKAERLATRLGAREPAKRVAEPEAPSGLWELTVPVAPFVAPRLKRVSNSTELYANLSALVEPGGDRRRAPEAPAPIWSELQLLGVVRHADVAGPDAARDLVSALPWQDENSDYRYAFYAFYDPILEALYDGVLRPGLATLTASADLVGVPVFDVRTRRPARPLSLHHHAAAFRYLLAREALQRLERTDLLLSTPEYGDGSISFDHLVARIDVCNGATYGPRDLYQALLRLRPTDPSELSKLDGMVLAPDLDVALPGVVDLPDGVDAVRAWVRAGGLPPVSGVPHRQVWRRTCEPPLSPSTFGIPMPESDSRFSPLDPLTDQWIVPAWYELDCTSDSDGLHHAYPAGLITHCHLARRLCDADRKTREAAVRFTVALMAQGRFDPAVFTQTIRDLAGELALGRLMSAWDLIVPAAGLRPLWPAALALADGVATTRPIRTGAADVFAWLRRYFHEVPDVSLPESVTAMAGEPGSTKAHFEARALCAKIEEAVAS